MNSYPFTWLGPKRTLLDKFRATTSSAVRASSWKAMLCIATKNRFGEAALRRWTMNARQVRAEFPVRILYTCKMLRQLVATDHSNGRF
ncbi:hypothetical protein AB9K35_20245 [Leisingera sp. XS_AS12]|uniref:hypothetical protein n=1 Tax=Leisingera sp. XS_AS12 TaxID=3241294 RepID=UPI00351415D3